MKIIAVIFFISLASCKSEREQLINRQAELHTLIFRADSMLQLANVESAIYTADSITQMVDYNVDVALKRDAKMPIIDKAKSDSLISAIRSWNDTFAKYRQEFEKIEILLKK